MNSTSKDFFNAALGLSTPEESLKDLIDRERFRPIERPDHTDGPDANFVSEFITPEMKNVFFEISLEYLENDPVYNDRKKRWLFWSLCYPVNEESCVEDFYNFTILAMMLISAREGSDYSRKILISLYKTYYKKEYNSLKRFHRFGIHDMLAFTAPYLEHREESEADHDVFRAVSRLTIMCEMLGIELDGSWNRLIEQQNRNLLKSYVLMNMLCAAYYSDGVQSNRENAYSENISWLRAAYPALEWLDLSDVKKSSQFSILSDIETMIGQAFDRYACHLNILMDDVPFDAVHHASKALYVNEDLRNEDKLNELLLYAVINWLSESYARLETRRETELTEILQVGKCSYLDDDDLVEMGVSEEELSHYRTTIENLTYGKWDDQSEKLLHSLMNLTPVDHSSKIAVTASAIPKMSKGQEESDELQNLKARLAEKDRKISELENKLLRQRTLYEEALANERTLRHRLDSVKTDHSELIALREFVHDLECEVPADHGSSIEDMLQYLRSKKVIIVGGHENWVKKMRRLLPDWTYIDARRGLGIEAAVSSCDRLYFYTDICGHTMYYKFINAAIAQKKQYSFLHGTNTDLVIKTIYHDLID